MQYGLYADSLGQKIGLQNGDNIVAIDNKPVKNILTLTPDIMTTRGVKTLQVKRNGNIINIPIPGSLISDLTHTKLTGFIDVQYPVIVYSV